MHAKFQNFLKFIQDDLPKFFLRLGVGGMMLLHGFAKVSGGLDMIRNSLTQSGMSTVWAPAVYLGEIVAPICLILGFATRISALILTVNMFFTLYLVHREHLFTLNEFGGWEVELNVFYLVTSVALLLSGGGRIAIKRSGILS